MTKDLITTRDAAVLGRMADPEAGATTAVPPIPGTPRYAASRGVLRQLEAIARKYRITIGELLSSSRTPEVSAARAEGAYMVREAGFSWPETGRIMGRDASSAMVAAARFATKHLGGQKQK